MNDAELFSGAHKDAFLAVMLMNNLQAKFYSQGRLEFTNADFLKIDQVEIRLRAAISQFTTMAQFTRGAARPKISP